MFSKRIYSLLVVVPQKQARYVLIASLLYQGYDKFPIKICGDDKKNSI